MADTGFLPLIFTCLIGVALGAAPAPEKLLHDDLLLNYSSHIRPVINQSQTVEIKFGKALIDIEDLDEKSQMLTLHGWLKFSWKDDYLKWAASDYGGIYETRMPIDKIWKPDIMLYNSKSLDMWETAHETLPLIYSDGSVLWIPPIRMMVKCSMDLTRFPYDKHECQLKFGSWTYDATKVNITWYGTDGKIELDNFQENQEFELESYGGVRSDKVYACCPNNAYPDITYTLVLKRRSTYHVHLYMAPSIALMFLMPTMFLLPPDSTEKINLGAGILVCQTLLLVSMEILLPSAHPTVPLLGVFYLTNIVLTGMSLFFSAVIVGCWAKSNRNSMVPQFLRSIFLGILGRLLCVRRETFMPVEAQEPVNMRRLDMLGGRGSDGGDAADPGYVEDDKQRMMQTYARLTTVSEWRQLAAILDRLFFVIFSITAALVFFIMGTG